jgi:hypothetical protein
MSQRGQTAKAELEAIAGGKKQIPPGVAFGPGYIEAMMDPAQVQTGAATDALNAIVAGMQARGLTGAAQFGEAAGRFPYSMMDLSTVPQSEMQGWYVDPITKQPMMGQMPVPQGNPFGDPYSMLSLENAPDLQMGTVTSPADTTLTELKELLPEARKWTGRSRSR